MKTQPHAATILKWLRDNGQSLGALTGQDTRALQLCVSAMALYSSCDQEMESHALSAFRGGVVAMQPSTRHLAYHAVAHVLDWPAREMIWRRAECPELGRHPGHCTHE